MAQCRAGGGLHGDGAVGQGGWSWWVAMPAWSKAGCKDNDGCEHTEEQASEDVDLLAGRAT
ncbi:hypothetical protein L7F22_061567, partial [Adiantum nelumboides]|nr:hypothetical protein [Adiantum nelumboides]